MPDGLPEASAGDPARAHASTVVWKESGLLIRGAAGAGKTTLAHAFVAEGRRLGAFCRFVADDVTLLYVAGGRVIARPHARIAGLAERRGLGVVALDHEPACVLGLIIDLAPDAPPRMPEAASLRVSLLGTILPRLTLWRDAPTLDNVYRALDFFAAFRACS